MLLIQGGRFQWRTVLWMIELIRWITISLLSWVQCPCETLLQVMNVSP